MVEFNREIRQKRVIKPIPPTTRIGQLAWLTSDRLTRWIAMWCGESIPILLVAEHPRSGGTWLAHMLADYFEVPFPKYNLFPTGCSAVVHTHLKYSPRLKRAVFVMRDGRDLAVSSYFYVLKRIGGNDDHNTRNKRYLRRYPSLQNATGGVEDCRLRLPQFLREWSSRPVGCRPNWEDYTRSWTKDRSNVVVSSYESLREDCCNEFRKIVHALSGDAPLEPRLQATVEKYSFAAQTGRQPGEQDIDSNKRKGVPGDWRNYFNRESAQIFWQLFGGALVEFGYEPNDSWVGECDAVPMATERV